eukprot:6692563-Prymnesium_polylepis.1
MVRRGAMAPRRLRGAARGAHLDIVVGLRPAVEPALVAAARQVLVVADGRLRRLPQVGGARLPDPRRR